MWEWDSDLEKVDEEANEDMKLAVSSHKSEQGEEMCQAFLKAASSSRHLCMMYLMRPFLML